jgi:hypothetical protein
LGKKEAGRGANETLNLERAKGALNLERRKAALNAPKAL